MAGPRIKIGGASAPLDRYLADEYRTAEDYRRYGWENQARREAMTAFFRTYRRRFGRRVLDLGCGGGVLGMVLAPTGRSYVGVDANPDMIRQAREAAKDSDFGQRFLSGDICRAKVSGRFDTVTLLGNTLAHLTLKEMDELLRVRKANVHRNTTFLMDYRDLIAMFWHGSWSSVKIQTHVVGKVVHRATKLDLERGILEMRARPSTRRWVLDWGHAIWSPFILEVLMQLHGWRLVHRSPRIAEKGAKAPLEHYVDIYRLP